MPGVCADARYGIGGRVLDAKSGLPIAGVLATMESTVAKTGSDGWMLWNPRNVYTTAGLTIRPAQEKADAQE